MIICLEPKIAVAAQKIFYIEISHKCGLRRATVAIAEIAVHKKTVVEEARRKSHVKLKVGEVSLVTTECRHAR